MIDQERLNKVTEEVSKKIKSLFGDLLCNIILYGSYARGDYDEESDIDIIVLANIPSDDDLWEWEEKINKISSRMSLENNIMVSICLYDKTYFNEWASVMPYFKNVLKDGKAFYEQQ